MKNDLQLVIICGLMTFSLGCHAHSQDAQSGQAMFINAPSSPITVGGKPVDVALGDWNRDGKLDLVTCNEGNRMMVLLGDGRGGFEPAAGSPMDVAGHLIAVGDVNNDRHLDLAITHHDSLGVVVLLGAGDGRFKPAPGSPFAALQGLKPHNHGLTLSDVNKDGNLDITTANHEGNSVSVLLGNGKAGFTPATNSPFAVGRGPYPHAVADVNQDGKPDIVTPNVGGNSVSILLGDGKGGFTAAANSPIMVASRPFYMTAGDVSGDGKPDLLMAHDDINTLTILLGDGRGNFRAAPNSPLDLGGRAFEIIARDFNGDAKADIVAATNTIVTVLLNDGRGGFKPAAGSPFAVGRGAFKADIGDVNGDSKLDIITANSESSNVTVLLGQ